MINESYRFVRDLDEDPSTLTWEERVAKKYYDQLYKEYCLADLRYYREGKIAMRWRTEREVISGKGQFICANLSCDERDGLRSWEVNFAYVEDNIPKNALVKVRLCPECSDKLNYRKRQRLAKVEEEQEESNEVSNHSTDHHTSSPSIETESSTNAMEVDHLDHTSSHQHIKKTSSDERTESRRRYSSKKSHRRSRSPTGTYHRTRDRSDYERTHRHDTSSRDASRNDDDDDDDDDDNDSFQHRTTTSTLRSHRR
jgi:protein FRA10AC1